MRRLSLLLLAALLLAQGPALAQRQERSGMSRQESQSRGEDRRQSFTRERTERADRQHRFTPEERRKLRQDLLDANREMRGRKGRK